MVVSTKSVEKSHRANLAEVMQCNLTVAYDFSDGLVKKHQVFFFLKVNGMIVPNNSPPPPPPPHHHHHHRRHDCSGIVSLLFFSHAPPKH